MILKVAIVLCFFLSATRCNPLLGERFERFREDLRASIRLDDDFTRNDDIDVMFPRTTTLARASASEEAKEWLSNTTPLSNSLCDLYKVQAVSTVSNPGCGSSPRMVGLPPQCMSFFNPYLSGFRFLVYRPLFKSNGLGVAVNMINHAVKFALLHNLTFVSPFYVGYFKNIGPQDAGRNSVDELQFLSGSLRLRWYLRFSQRNFSAIEYESYDVMKAASSYWGLEVKMNRTGVIDSHYLVTRDILARNYFTRQSAPMRVNEITSGSLDDPDTPAWESPNIIRVVLHVRRGDVTADGRKTKGRFQPESMFSVALTSLIRGLKAAGEDKDLLVRVYSQTGFNQSAFELNLRERGRTQIVYRINANIPEFFQYVASCDVYMPSWSSFARFAALFVSPRSLTLATVSGGSYVGVPNACSVVFLNGNEYSPESRICGRASGVQRNPTNETWLVGELKTTWLRLQRKQWPRQDLACSFACERHLWLETCSRYPEHYLCDQVQILDSIVAQP